MRIGKLLLALLLVAGATAWERKKCGFTDQVTEWGRAVDPAKGIPLPEYPRPQMSRETSAASQWAVLNGLWEFSNTTETEANPPYGQTFDREILVPFPVESCLSGIGENYPRFWYRRSGALPVARKEGERVLLHFGAVDWECFVFVDGTQVGHHQGGYDAFYFDITDALKAQEEHEILVYVYDPSESGPQPNGKQAVSRIAEPSGCIYIPASGIWQTVWLETVPEVHVSYLKITPTMKTVTVNVHTEPNDKQYPVTLTAKDADGNVVAVVEGKTFSDIEVVPADPHLWGPGDPYLYSLSVSLNNGADAVESYFALREFVLKDVYHPGTEEIVVEGKDNPGGDLANMPVYFDTDDYNQCRDLCNSRDDCLSWGYGIATEGCEAKPTCWLKGSRPGAGTNACRVYGEKAKAAGTVKRPFFNGEPIFLNGWLDQSYWPDGIYTAPSDEALKFDLEAVLTFGYNTVRLHEKVNPERWYWYADKLGILVFQDMPQKYGGATAETVPYFMSDLDYMIPGKYSHPCIIQWTAFNEYDCYGVFDVPSVIEHMRELDPTRPINTDSGGGANGLYIGDVNDIHTYPWPGHPTPSETQYACVGEYGGMGAFIAGKEWADGKCYAYMNSADVAEQTEQYLKMISMVEENFVDISSIIFTQITDVETECDGFFTYDRTHKMNATQIAQVKEANQRLINMVYPY